MMRGLKPLGSLSGKEMASILIGVLGLVLPAAVRASSDPVGMQAYHAYQGIDISTGGLDYSHDPSSYAWGESYILDSFVSMYEGTKNTTYLDRLTQQFDVVLSYRDDQVGTVDYFRNKVMPAWSTTAYTGGKQYAWAGHAGLITDAASRFVYLVKSTPGLQTKYLAKAQQYETAIEQTVDAFDSDWHQLSGQGYYTYDIGSGPVVSPYNLQTALGQTMVNLYLAGNSKYLNKAADIARFFKNHLTKISDRYKWSYSSTTSDAEDISYGAMNVDFAVDCYRAGIVFSLADMNRFSATFKKVSKGSSGFAANVDGSGTSTDPWQAGLWGHLGYVDSQVRQILGDWFGVYGQPSAQWYDGHVCMASAGYLVETSPILIPEPSALVLLGFGAVSLLAYYVWNRRRRSSTVQAFRTRMQMRVVAGFDIIEEVVGQEYSCEKKLRSNMVGAT